MTRVDFYTGVDDKSELARQIAVKAWRQGSRVLVHSHNEALLDALDRHWWTHPPSAFLPHARAHATHAPQSPVVLGSAIGDLPHCDVLINLSEQTPGFFTRFERLIEIVTTDEPDRQAARVRWRFYQQRGYALHNHDMASVR